MTKTEELIESFYEIEPLNREQFLKVRETLTRIGIGSQRPDESGKPVLWQTCHVLHKRGRYYICHFKQLFLLDGRDKVTDYTDEDMDRTEHIVAMLEEWGLIRAKNLTERVPVNIMVIQHGERNNWSLRSKYAIGENRNVR